ncbi:hypothetical protein QP503_07695 [Pauljensenia sp. UMB0895]|nr:MULTISPECIES: hypothetical protein [unclassified Pauljensenia]MDK7230611.1 hypothetical protein [Pauljensenia sp. UMB1177]MDK7338624.1 hypothetical protein [Pauljensenia sp. UMB0895]
MRALKDANYSLADISYIMGLSRSRVCQLLTSAPRKSVSGLLPASRVGR